MNTKFAALLASISATMIVGVAISTASFSTRDVVFSNYRGVESSHSQTRHPSFVNDEKAIRKTNAGVYPSNVRQSYSQYPVAVASFSPESYKRVDYLDGRRHLSSTTERKQGLWLSNSSNIGGAELTTTNNDSAVSAVHTTGISSIQTSENNIKSIAEGTNTADNYTKARNSMYWSKYPYQGAINTIALCSVLMLLTFVFALSIQRKK